MRKTHDDPSRCAACGATDTQLRRPRVGADERPDMRVCRDDRPCFDRFVARRDLAAAR